MARSLKLLVQLLQRDGEATPTSVAEAHGFSADDAHRLLSEACAKGVVERVGRGLYRRRSSGPPPAQVALGATCRPGWLHLAADAARVYADRLTDAIEETDGPVAAGLVRIRREVHAHLGRLEAAL